MGGPSELTDHLGYWLRLVSNHVSHAFALKAEECGVTVAEWVLLRRLWAREPVAPSRLAEETGLTRGAVSKLADRLLAKGLVERVDSREDRRAHTLALTAAGQALVPRLADLADRNDAQFFGELAPEDREQLELTLRAIVQRKGIDKAPVD